MSGIIGGTTEAATNASAELVLVESPSRLPRLSALLERDSENSHVLVHDGSESRRQFWLRGLKRARDIVGRGKQIRTLSYVMAPEPGGAQLPERVAKAFARTLSPGSTMILHASGSPSPEVFDTLERIGTTLRGVNAKAVFEGDSARQPKSTYLRAS